MASTTSEKTSVAHLVQNKMLIRGIYDKAAHDDLNYAKAWLHQDFIYTSPKYLPWGGVTRSANDYWLKVMPQIASVIDYGRFSYSSLTAEDDCVVALFDVGVVDSSSEVTLCEHWFLEDGLIRSMWSTVFEPLPLLVAIEQMKSHHHCLRSKWAPS